MRGEADFPSRSEADYAFIAYLTKANFPMETIKTIARRNPLGRGNELLDNDVERIVSKVQANNHISKSFISHTSIYTTNLEKRKPGYSTGFQKLDEMLAGLQRGKVYVLGARTNEGKTSFATQLSYILVKNGTSVLYFPTELGYEPLFDKLVAQQTQIALKKFQFGNFTTEEKSKIKDATVTLSKFPFMVHEDFGLTLDTIKKVSKEVCPGCMVIDYIQAMKYEEGSPQEMAVVMRGIKQVSEELNVPIIVCCQLNRSAINNEINLSQLKGSGAIEEFSDVVMVLSTLSRQEYPRPVELIILKNRYGEVGHIRLDFFSTIGNFKEHEKENT
jgi:replicative DNA helicase